MGIPVFHQSYKGTNFHKLLFASSEDTLRKEEEHSGFTVLNK